MSPATLVALLPILDASIQAAARIMALIDKCAKENRDPTPKEWEELGASRSDVESKWRELAPKR